MSLVLAGLDLATTSGMALMKDRITTSSTFKAHVKKNILDDDKALNAEREGEVGRKFEDHLHAWLIENEVGHVAIEAPIPSNNTRRKATINTAAKFALQAITYEDVAGTSLSSIFRIYGLEFLAVTVCRRLNIPCEFVTQGTWRKAFLGNGRPKDAKKEAKAMCEKLGIACSSLDAAEAVGVVWWLDQKLNPYGARRAHDLFKEATA